MNLLNYTRTHIAFSQLLRIKQEFVARLLFILLLSLSGCILWETTPCLHYMQMLFSILNNMCIFLIQFPSSGSKDIGNLVFGEVSIYACQHACVVCFMWYVPLGPFYICIFSSVFPANHPLSCFLPEGLMLGCSCLSRHHVSQEEEDSHPDLRSI